MAKKTGEKNSKTENKETKMTDAVETATVDQATEAPSEVKRGESKIVPKMKITAPEVYGKTEEEILAAVAAGKIEGMGWKLLTIGSKKKPSPTGKIEGLVYDRYRALNFEGQLFLSSDREEVLIKGDESEEDEDSDIIVPKGATDHYNYGADLETKRILRGKLGKMLEGPQKQILKSAQALYDTGWEGCETLEKAIAVVKARRAATGKEI